MSLHKLPERGNLRPTDWLCRSAFRFWNAADRHLSDTGLRLVCEIEFE